MILCKRGHPHTPENTRTRTHSRTGKIYIACRLCEVARQRAWEAANPQRNKRVKASKPPAPPKHHPEWPPARIEQLRALWAEGLSTAAIGRRMNMSKSAIVGKAHRLHLPGRPTPIKPRSADAQRKPTVATRMRAAAAATGTTPMLAIPDHPSYAARAPVRLMVPMSPMPAARGTCCWLDGERGAYVCCTADAKRGAYCAEHAARAYQPARVAA